MKKRFAKFARFAVPLLLCFSTTSCSTFGVASYVATNAHLETAPRGAGVCIGLPVIPAEICLTAQPKNKQGDIGTLDLLGGLFKRLGQPPQK